MAEPATSGFFLWSPKGPFLYFCYRQICTLQNHQRETKTGPHTYYHTKFRHTMNEWFFSPFYSFSKTMKMMLWAKHCRHTNVGSLYHMCWDPCMSNRQWDRRWLWRPDNPTKHRQPVPSNTLHSFRYVIANGICKWYHPSTAGTMTGPVEEITATLCTVVMAQLETGWTLLRCQFRDQWH